MPKSRQRKLKGFTASTIAKLGLLGITLGAFGATTASASVETNQAITEQSQAPKEQPKQVEAQPVEIVNNSLTRINRRNYGTPPKQYGQWLQATGRQKWNKRSLK